MSLGKHILGRCHVLPSVVSSLTILQVEGTFTTGTHLITVDEPIGTSEGDIDRALYGSFLPRPPEESFPAWPDALFELENVAGAIIPADKGKVELNPGRKRTRVRVTNRGDRPIQVCSPVFLLEIHLGPMLMRINRWDRISTSSKRTPNSTSTA